MSRAFPIIHGSPRSHILCRQTWSVISPRLLQPTGEHELDSCQRLPTFLSAVILYSRQYSGQITTEITSGDRTDVTDPGTSPDSIMWLYYKTDYTSPLHPGLDCPHTLLQPLNIWTFIHLHWLPLFLLLYYPAYSVFIFIYIYICILLIVYSSSLYLTIPVNTVIFHIYFLTVQILFIYIFNMHNTHILSYFLLLYYPAYSVFIFIYIYILPCS